MSKKHSIFVISRTWSRRISYPPLIVCYGVARLSGERIPWIRRTVHSLLKGPHVGPIHDHPSQAPLDWWWALFGPGIGTYPRPGIGPGPAWNRHLFQVWNRRLSQPGQAWPAREELSFEWCPERVSIAAALSGKDGTYTIQYNTYKQ